MARKALEGDDDPADFATNTDDGIAIKPLYTDADWRSNADPSGFPGLPPYTRGRRAIGPVENGWDIRQRHAHPDLAACNAAMRQDIAGGVTSVLLAIDKAGRLGLDTDEAENADTVGADGTMVSTADDLVTVLAGLDLAAVPVTLDAGGAFLPVAGFLKEAWRRNGIAPEKARGAFNADPLGALAADGFLPDSVDGALRQMAVLTLATAGKYPNVRSIGVDTAPYHEAGATEAQELACGLATGVAYLRVLEKAGMSAGAAFAQITLSHSVDADLFLSIAKLRTARRLWSRVAETCGVPAAAAAVMLNARSSRRMMSQRDPWVNLLRTTIACFAGAVGGADSITLLPFDAALGVSDAFARRIARNTQLVLREESSLHRVLDPAGGAWALESLADSLAAKAWIAFQEIEAAGGMARVLGDGTLAARVQAKWLQRARRVARWEEPVTGVSDFPDLKERPVRTEAVDIVNLRADARKRLARHRSAHKTEKSVAAVRRTAEASAETLPDAIDAAAAAGATVAVLSRAVATGPPVSVPALPRHRLGEAFEDLRDRSDSLAARTGRRPCVFVAVIGEPGEHSGRSMFARNALAAAGVETVLGPGGTEAGATVAAFRSSGTSVVVVCSSDTLYKAHAAEWIGAMRSAGARRILLVGTEGDLRDNLSHAASEIDAFMHRGCDMLRLLRGILEEFGVESK